MRLSALAIRNAKTREKAYKLGDGHGLYLLIKPSGTRLWRMNYTHMGRQKTLSFGEWPLAPSIWRTMCRRSIPPNDGSARG